MRLRTNSWETTEPRFARSGALDAALDRLFQRAAYPARGFVPANAEAVAFTNRTELLYCLALDWVRGELAHQWWWSVLFPRLDAAETMCRAWRSDPQRVPAALERLHQMGQSAPFLRSLPAGFSRSMATEIAHTFAMEAVLEAIELATESLASVSVSLRAEPPLPLAHPGAATASESREVPPWARWLGKETPLSSETHALLVLAVMLVRAPAAARSSSFIRDLQDFSRKFQSLKPEAEPTHERLFTPRKAPTSHRPEPNPVQNELSLYDPSARTHVGLPEQEFRIPPGPPTPLPGTSIQPTTRAALTRNEPSHRELASPSGAERNGLTSAVTAGPPTSLGEDTGTESLPPPAPISSIVVEYPLQVVDSAWGGIFYLINVALALDLYGDFTHPRQPSLSLVPWDFLALMGREMIGQNFLSDPGWDALASLSGRGKAENPGSEFEPPAEWRMPLAWLIPFPEKTGWQAIVRDGRLLVQHPAHFRTLDVPCTPEEAISQFSAECCRLGMDPATVDLQSSSPLSVGFINSDIECTDSSVPAFPLNPPLARWLGWLKEYLQARLARALGEPDPDVMRQLVFHRAARIRIGSESVAVHFSLADHPIALRMAGLDRDPGWVPAAGRAIGFHYD
jgi:hypothetical protein